MTTHKDRWLTVGVILALALVTVLAAIQEARSAEPPPYSTISNHPDGARVLALWLEEIGFRVSKDPQDEFLIPEQTTVAMIMEPLTLVTEDDWLILDAWIEQGGTLLIAGNGAITNFAIRHFDVEMTYSNEMQGELSPQLPVFYNPDMPNIQNFEGDAGLQSSRDDLVPLLAVDGRLVVAALQLDAGRVILSASAFPFTNLGLKQAGMPELVLNLLSGDSSHGTIWFDEWHHGLRGSGAGQLGPGSWLRSTYAGRALLLSAAILLVTLAMRGRSFGRYLETRQRHIQRAPLEHITALANLSHRAGHRSAALDRYHFWLKRNLGARYRLDPNLEDQIFIQQLSAMEPDLDAAKLLSLLASLRQANVTESDFVERAAAAARWSERNGTF